MLELTNGDRARDGLVPLQLDVELLDIARVRAAAEAAEAVLSHLDPDGREALERLLDAPERDTRFPSGVCGEGGGRRRPPPRI